MLTELNAGGCAVLMATHNKRMVDELRRRVVTFEGGRIIAAQPSAGHPGGILAE